MASCRSQQPVQVEVELEQHVDAWLAQEAQERLLGVPGDGRADPSSVHAPGRGDAGDLVLGGLPG